MGLYEALKIKPVFYYTPIILQLAADINLKSGAIFSNKNLTNLYLHQINRICTIQDPLAVKASTLNKKQSTAFLDKKRVIAPLRKI
ncbi:MAG: hypothetical protein AMR96_05980 [Candidatus Adiutrix intracellularis]|nr:MAG: hypothetical protein AMR96_05980 [Candidatus Adiutrix intracellularis]